METTRRMAVVDVAWVIGVSLTYVALEAAHVPKRWSYLAVAVLLAAFGVYIARRGADSWRDLGFRYDNLRAGIGPASIFTLIAGCSVIAWAAAHGQAVWSAQVAVLLGLYPAWALVQQLAFQGVLHRKLMVIVPSRTLQVLIPACAFAAVHVGNTGLVALTFVAGVSWSMLYRRYPNLWLLGASHTVLAALAYPLVLGDAPLSRL